MNYNNKALIHDLNCFERETLEERSRKFGSGNIMRIELFIWDLEMYLQIQSRLDEKIILKGGAATQFYLPIEFQRTSVDIDMICFCSKNEIENVISDIEKQFKGDGSLFKFKPHRPKEPKTDLPLLTYFVDVPSVCTDKELYKKPSGKQEIKAEFFIEKKLCPYQMIKKPSIFALETDKNYQVISLDTLIGDKLTTLGSNTIGIPKNRLDELIKQIYDLNSLIEYNKDKIDTSEIKKFFIQRAELECKTRNINFNLIKIVSDMRRQMRELASIDFKKNRDLEKLINDFQGLYLRKAITKSIGQWALIGDKLRNFIESIQRKRLDKECLKRSYRISDVLGFSGYEGVGRGEIVRKFRIDFSKEFSKYCEWPFDLLKGKSPQRMFWSVVSHQNIDEIDKWIDNFINQID